MPVGVSMPKNLAVLAWMSVGAGMLLLLDPAAGARRRARLREKAVRLAAGGGAALAAYGVVRMRSHHRSRYEPGATGQGTRFS
jgi:hypothetical protein